MRIINTDSREIISQAALETLESRQLMSAVSFEDGVLIVRGSTLRHNNLAVEMSTDGKTVWGTANQTGGGVIKISQVRQIRIIGGEKRDRVRVDSRIRIPVYVQTGNGNDDVQTGRGSDTIVTGNGRDVIRSRGGNDVINGGNEHDWIDAGTGNDRVDGDDGTDTLAGGAGRDTLSGNSGDDKVTGGTENDRLIAGIGIDSLRGGTGNDTLMGDTDDVLAGDDGDDTITRETTGGGVGHGGQSGGGQTGGGQTGGGQQTQIVPAVQSFTLIDADTNQPIAGYESITGNTSIDLGNFQTRRLAIRANVAESATFTGSVVFSLDGVSAFAIDGAAPFSLHGDNAGDYVAWTPTVGAHRIAATAHWGQHGRGKAGSMLGFTFTVRDSSTNPNPEPTVGAPVPVINLLENSVNAGHTIHVNALNSNLKSGNVLNAKFEWDFGDPNGRFNKLPGWNAAHTYDDAGNYVIKLKITNSTGLTTTRSFDLTVAQANRKVIYVSNQGSDSNSGLSPQTAIKSIAKAVTLMTDNTEILLQSGGTFSMSAAVRIGKSNVVFGAYGSGHAPTVVWSGANSYVSLFATDSSSHDVTFQDLSFDHASSQHIFSVGGTNFTVRRCEFLHVDYVVNNNRKPTGVMVQDNDVPLVNGMKGYLAWIQGTDQVYLGNSVANSVEQHCLRVGGASRVLIAYNDLTNVSSHTSGVSYDIAKGTISIHNSDHMYISKNKLTGGDLGFGPLGGGDGFTNATWQTDRATWGVIEENHTHGSEFRIVHGTDHLMIRNNVIERNDSQAMEVDGYNAPYQRGVSDVHIINNTVMNTGTSGKFLWVHGRVNGIQLKDNLLVAPNMVTGLGGTAAVYVSDSSLASFTEIDGNIWNVPRTTPYSQGGYLFIGSTFNSGGYTTPTEWNALPQVGDDYYQNISLGSSYQGSVAGHIAGASLVRAA